jgi:dephospho-CoA kinase
VALTGGIGSGKSSVAARLAARGAIIVDADLLARQVVEPGTPGLDAVVAEFGPTVLGPDGALDRASLAALVFSDPERRAALEQIVHPLVGARAAQLLADAPPGALVVYDIPLLAESVRAGHDRTAEFDAVIVVEAPEDVRVHRLVGRGMHEEDARARIAAQATDAERRALADVVVDNGGDLQQLDEQIERVLQMLAARRGGASGSPGPGVD